MADVETISVTLPQEKQAGGDELRRLWIEAIEDDRPAVDADEVLDRLERKYQEMVDRAAGAK